MHDLTRNRDLALRAIHSLSPSRADLREDWIRVGMALKSVEDSDEFFTAWCSWSALSEKFDERVAGQQWRSFDNRSGGVGIGTLLQMADQDSPGWRSRRSPCQPPSSVHRTSPKRGPEKKPPSRRFADVDALVEQYENLIGGQAVRKWLYFSVDSEGRERESFGVIRFDLPERDPITGKPRKEFRPYHHTRSDATNPYEVAAEYPEGLRVLYNLREIVESADVDPVVIVEGEKCADAIRFSTGMVATTSAGGASGISKTDWSPLAGRGALLAPDNDAAGRRWEAKMIEILRSPEVGAIVLGVLRLPLPEKGDVADFLVQVMGSAS